MNLIESKVKGASHDGTALEVSVNSTENRVAVEVILKEGPHFSEAFRNELIQFGDAQSLKLVDFILYRRNAPEGLQEGSHGDGKLASTQGNQPGHVGLGNLGEERVENGNKTVHEYGTPCEACSVLATQGV